MAEKLDRIIAVLEQPLGAADLEGGWVDQSRVQWHEIFSDLRGHVKAGRALDPKYRSFFIAVGLDGWGIGGGPLCQLAEKIGGDLRDALREEARARGEPFEPNDSEVPSDPERMKLIHMLLSEREPELNDEPGIG